MHKDQTLDIFIKSMVSLKMSILQIWVTWASKITLKNLQLCSIKMKGSHTPCDVTRSRSIRSFPKSFLKKGLDNQWKCTLQNVEFHQLSVASRSFDQTCRSVVIHSQLSPRQQSKTWPLTKTNGCGIGTSSKHCYIV